MATRADYAAKAQGERIFFTGMAIAMLATVFAGFAPTYYLLDVLHGRTASGLPGGANLTPLVHVHAGLFSGWMLLFAAQTALIAGGKPSWHRTLGVAAVALAAAMLVIGVLTAIEGSRLGHRPPMLDKYVFFIVPIAGIVLFGAFVAAGVWTRARSAYHKRFMLLATFALLTPAIVRLHLPIVPPGPVGGFIVTDAFILAACVWDWRSNGRVHPALLWGSLAFIASQPLRLMFAQTELWRSFAAGLIG